MDPVGDVAIRESFVNCSKGEARRLHLPKALADLPWPDLDFLGWRDPGAPDRAYLIAQRNGKLIGVTLRVPAGARRGLSKSVVCSICLTSHAGSGVSLLVAPKAGEAGRHGNTVGAYMCADLACSLYVRGKKKSELTSRFSESLTLDEQIARTLANLDLFLDQIFTDSDRADSHA